MCFPKVTYNSDHKVTFTNPKLTNKVTWSWPELANIEPTITSSDLTVTYSDPKVTYIDPKHLLLLLPTSPDP